MAHMNRFMLRNILRRVRVKYPPIGLIARRKSVAKFHFVEDYERYVRDLKATHPIDDAMSIAVGGNFDSVGQIEAEVVKFAGLREGMTLLDLGCGSGRLASKIATELDIKYFGIDVVQDLLDYAKSKSPDHYKFIKSHTLSVPLPDRSIDMVCAFSLFTHLLHAETYLYLQDCIRVLKPGGRIVFSFLEFANPGHWHVFSETVEAQRASAVVHLNQFIEKASIETWCQHLNLEVENFVPGQKTLGR